MTSALFHLVYFGLHISGLKSRKQVDHRFHRYHHSITSFVISDTHLGHCLKNFCQHTLIFAKIIHPRLACPTCVSNLTQFFKRSQIIINLGNRDH